MAIYAIYTCFFLWCIPYDTQFLVSKKLQEFLETLHIEVKELPFWTFFPVLKHMRTARDESLFKFSVAGVMFSTLGSVTNPGLTLKCSMKINKYVERK